MKLLVEPILDPLAVLFTELLLLTKGGFFLPTLGATRLLGFLRTGDGGEDGGVAFLFTFPGYNGLLLVTFTLYFLFGDPFLGNARLLFGLKFV